MALGSMLGCCAGVISGEASTKNIRPLKNYRGKQVSYVFGNMGRVSGSFV